MKILTQSRLGQRQKERKPTAITDTLAGGPTWHASSSRVQTLTPTTLASWVGAKLRTIAGEGSLAWQGADFTVSMTSTIYADNDTPGDVLAQRGWRL
jgi:hypothetical protein